MLDLVAACRYGERVSNRALALAVAVIAAGAVLYLWPRGPKDPEAQIRALVAECVDDANKKDVAAISERVDERFVGPQGMGKNEVKQLLAFQLLRQQEVAVILNPTLSVEVKSPESATMVGFFVFGRTKVKTAEELSQNAVAAVYKITASLERKDGRWWFTGAQYQAVNGW
jgi:hypothetical protein